VLPAINEKLHIPDLLMLDILGARKHGMYLFDPGHLYHFSTKGRKSMNEKHGHVFVNDDTVTKPADWDKAFVSHSTDELRAIIASRRTRGPNKLPTKEQVAVRYSPEVLAYFRATGAGWQTRMDDVLREYVAKHSPQKEREVMIQALLGWIE